MKNWSQDINIGIFFFQPQKIPSSNKSSDLNFNKGRISVIPGKMDTFLICKFQLCILIILGATYAFQTEIVATFYIWTQHNCVLVNISDFFFFY